MKFAHLADCHLGGWREPKLREANEKYFVAVIDRILAEQVDFCLIAGDLFNTSFPPMDCLKLCVEKLKQLSDASIPVYIIAGSHDFSPSGKTVISVLESAGLAINVAKAEVVNNKLRLKFTTDKKTGIKITGIIGKRGGLDKNFYAELDRERIESESGQKIFMFHCTIQEIKPKEFEDIEAMSISSLPKNFDYYAGGHVHVVSKHTLDGYKNVIYPGPTFPNNFAEIEKLKQGSFCIVEDWNVKHINIELNPVKTFFFDCNNKSSGEVERDVSDALQKENLTNSIVTLRFSGVLKNSRTSDIKFNEISEKIQSLGAYFVLKNTNKLESKEFEQINVSADNSDKIEDVESIIIAEHSGKSKIFEAEQEKLLSTRLIQSLSIEKDDGQKTADFEKRIVQEVEGLF
ncbi:MAG: exonuclease SbcCD subunit D [Nanoarchaeota archaeon]